MRSDMVRMQCELAVDRKQREESKRSEGLQSGGPSVSTVRTACADGDVCRLPSEGKVSQQKQQRQQVLSLKKDITDIADEVCDMFAGPLNALTDSVRRAESDMGNLQT